MKVRRTAIAATALAAGVLAASVGGLAQAGSDGLRGVALYGGGTKLARFSTEEPDEARKIGNIGGLTGDTKLVGIDRRVQNGKLYGVGDQGGLYTLSTSSAAATKVGQLGEALSGTSFGVDFNPAANALRIISDTGQNLRQPFATAGDAPNADTVPDSGLNYTAVTAPGVTGAAYTNNDLNADTATTLFDLDTTLDQVAIQAPANSGSLSPTGKLGVNAGPEVGFDIYTDLRSGKAYANKGFAVIISGGSARLFSVNLLTGDADNQGRFSKSDATDIALDLDR